MMLKASYCCALATAALVFTAQSASATAHTKHVGTCTRAQTTYVTIQSAIDAASDGDIVSVCPGNYAEQITVTKNIFLKNATDQASPHIVVPAGGLVANTVMSDGTATAAQILVAPAVAPGKRIVPSLSANVSGLTVDGANNNNTSCSALEMVGIYYQGAGGAIKNNTVQNQITVGHESCQNGIGILVENETVGTGSVSINGNSVSNFDKNGIVLRRVGSVGDITNNTVTGIGPTTLLAQNGILIRDDASANITGNNVSALLFTPDTFGSSGIILYNLSPANYQAPSTIQRNTVDTTKFGIVLDGAGGVDGSNMVQIVSNMVSNSGWDGIEIESDLTPTVNGDYVFVSKNTVSNTTEFEGIDSCGDNNTITRNTVTNSSNWAIHLDSLCEQANSDPSGTSNAVSNNRIDTACVGILSGPAEGENTISGTHFTNVTKAKVFGTDDYTCVPAHAPQHLNKAKGKSGKRLAVSP